ncbi:MAG: hypothetical protein J6V06_03470 [Clostridia bacterium]|nr:hypothetical protein [Clostridia bacterium]
MRKGSVKSPKAISEDALGHPRAVNGDGAPVSRFRPLNNSRVNLKVTYHLYKRHNL